MNILLSYKIIIYSQTEEMVEISLNCGYIKSVCGALKIAEIVRTVFCL